MTFIPQLRPGVVRAAISGDAIASLETGLLAAEQRIVGIEKTGYTRHIKGNCGGEPLLFSGPCDPARMRQVLIQPDLYETARQHLKNALAITPKPDERERWYSASARWAWVMRKADNLAWGWRTGLPVGTRSVAGGKDGVFDTPSADAFAQSVFDPAKAAAVRDMGHKGERAFHIDLLGWGPRVIYAWPEATTRGEADRAMWTAPDDYFEWSKWLDYDTTGLYRDCGGVFGSPCPGYPSGKRYHKTLRTNGAVRVEWWKKKLEVYSKYPLIDLLAYAWGGYSQYLDLNAAALGFTPAQMRTLAEVKNKADIQFIAGKVATIGAFIPVIGWVCSAIAGLIYALSEYLAAGCMFSFHQFQERVIDLPECGVWGEGATPISTVPRMYESLIAQGFDPQRRLDEMNAPPEEEPSTPAWLVPAAAAVGGLIVGAIVGKVVS